MTDSRIRTKYIYPGRSIPEMLIMDLMDEQGKKQDTY